MLLSRSEWLERRARQSKLVSGFQLRVFCERDRYQRYMPTKARSMWRSFSTLLSNPSRFRHGRRGWAVVAAAGPTVNLLLSGLCIVLCALVIRYANFAEPLSGNLETFLVVGGCLNIYLMIFNLMPVPPLDGSMILSGFSNTALRFFSKPGVQQFGVLALLLIVFSTNLAGQAVDRIENGTVYAIAFVVSVLPGSGL